jgi:apolipoprotein N-acyltransferase
LDTLRDWCSFSAVFYWLGALGALFRQPLLYGLPLLLALYMALYFAFWAWFLHRVLAPRPEQRLFPNSVTNLATGALAASAWIAHEWVRGWMFSGFRLEQSCRAHCTATCP